MLWAAMATDSSRRRASTGRSARGPCSTSAWSRSRPARHRARRSSPEPIPRHGRLAAGQGDLLRHDQPDRRQPRPDPGSAQGHRAGTGHSRGLCLGSRRRPRGLRLLRKGLRYEGVPRVPLIYRGPGVRRGGRVDEIASTTDIAATLLAFAGVEEPEGAQGTSQRGALAGGAVGLRRSALIENDDDLGAVRYRTDAHDPPLEGDLLRERIFRRALRSGRRSAGDAQPVGRAGVRSRESGDDGGDGRRAASSFETRNGRVQAPRPPVKKWLPRAASVR